MSYCRFNKGKSDVYAYGSGVGFRTILAGGQIDFTDRSRRKFYERLCKLKEAGLKIPAVALKRLREELGDTVRVSDGTV